jgi:hypothetical protein
LTDASEQLYLAATAKADLRTGTESIRKAIENLQILLDGEPTNAPLLLILKQLRSSLRDAEKASDGVYTYVRSLP